MCLLHPFWRAKDIQKSKEEELVKEHICIANQFLIFG